MNEHEWTWCDLPAWTGSLIEAENLPASRAIYFDGKAVMEAMVGLPLYDLIPQMAAALNAAEEQRHAATAIVGHSGADHASSIRREDCPLCRYAAEPGSAPEPQKCPTCSEKTDEEILRDDLCPDPSHRWNRWRIGLT